MQATKELTKLSHPNILCLIGITKFGDNYATITRYMENAELSNYLQVSTSSCLEFTFKFLLKISATGQRFKCTAMECEQNFNAEL